MAEIEFSGFSREAVDFLQALKANNSREWFTANKPAYETAVKRPAGQFCAAMTDQLQALTGIAHKSKIFRIHRDLRFSKDKTPYNTHLHISFIPDGKIASPPCWFFGLDPNRLTLGAGVFAFDKASLEIFRQRIDGEDGSKLAKLLGSLEREGVRISKPELKRVPAGYPQDHRHADLLRRKGLAMWIDYDDTLPATNPGTVKTCLSGFTRLKPGFDWLLPITT